MRLFALLLLITPAAANEWRQDPDGHWVSIDPGFGQWQRAPTGQPEWKWVQPDDDWRLDPNGRWRVVPR